MFLLVLLVILKAKVVGRIIDVGGGIRPGEDDPTTMKKILEVILISETYCDGFDFSICLEIPGTALSLVPLLMVGVELLSWI